MYKVVHCCLSYVYGWTESVFEIKHSFIQNRVKSPLTSYSFPITLHWCYSMHHHLCWSGIFQVLRISSVCFISWRWPRVVESLPTPCPHLISGQKGPVDAPSWMWGFSILYKHHLVRENCWLDEITLHYQVSLKCVLHHKHPICCRSGIWWQELVTYHADPPQALWVGPLSGK